jgi:hypothetical protein
MPKPAALQNLLQEANRACGAVVDRAIEDERLDPLRQPVDAGPLVVVLQVDLPGAFGTELPDFLDFGGVAEVTRQRRLGDAELGRPAPICRLIDVAALAANDVVDHSIHGWRHGH